MTRRAVALVLVLAALPALADDGKGGAAGPAKAGAPAAAAPAKKERKTTPEADAAIAKYASLIAFPSTKYKAFSFKASGENAMLGGEITMTIGWSEAGGLTCDVQVSETLRQGASPQQVKEIREGVSSAIRQRFAPFLLPATLVAKHYDLAPKAGATGVLEIAKFDEGAQWDKATLQFNADGLLEKQVGMLNVDPNDPMAAADAGAEIELTTKHVKKGDVWVVESAVMKKPLGEAGVKIAYFEIPGQAPIPREFTVTDDLLFADAPLVITVSDWTIDGKPVAGTEKKADPKTATGTAPAGGGK